MIEKVIGIGDGGSQIAEHFKKYYDYSVLCVSEKGDIKIPKTKKVEELETEKEDLQSLIGQQTIEINFLKKNLKKLNID